MDTRNRHQRGQSAALRVYILNSGGSLSWEKVFQDPAPALRALYRESLGEEQLRRECETEGGD